MQIVYTSDVGKVRKVNEDRVGAFENKRGHILALVADGLGGHLGGEVASDMAVSHLGYLFEETSLDNVTDASEWLKGQVVVENDSILQRADQYQDLAGMGTTLVCALLFTDKAMISNIGDSRAYRLRDGNFEQITEDHSYVNELVKRGEISKEEAKHHPHKNIITRTLGISKQAKVDSQVVSLQQGDIFLLCSDGLTNMVDDLKIQTILVDETTSLENKCSELVDQANLAGGSDNITVLLIKVDQGGKPK
ncbi:Stp1/IreP family PP2C-type Ser/Thr phosphatase [Ligilactobacillus apodemi]|uniref:protein-serine/threonine phosphatase n=1 Tax=Ligilactobacillus apodemi DSM 16634 = JCM 16172 TaxID=1423724 RepID=A0A0R1TY15_9LACO|nr:Stp1/IreP family PP2C-type Ser/Thr phosphatase [Ligilactobacillus apodemi]KRL83715.1 putative serine threonine specific protein phosphatase (putative) [Ligilactobacillus apodemi DSM 16634 = JCM 16172]